MPARQAPASYNRPWMALLLTSQWFVGAVLGFAARRTMVYAVLWRLLPAFGPNLVDLARSLARADYPGTLLICLLAGHAP